MNAKARKRHRFREFLAQLWAGTEVNRLKADNWHLLRDSSELGETNRDGTRRSHGVSSSALATFVLGGEKPRPGRYPMDGYDFAACVRAMDNAPACLGRLPQRGLYWLFRWVKADARAEGFKKGLAIGRKLGPKK